MSPTERKTSPVGSVWEITDASGRIRVTRPDDGTVEVASENGVARYVLTQSGTYRATLPDGTVREIRAK